MTVKPSIPAKPGGRRKLKEKEELLINMVNQAKEREVCGKRSTGSMNSSVNTLSLQEVILVLLCSASYSYLGNWNF